MPVSVPKVFEPLKSYCNQFCLKLHVKRQYQREFNVMVTFNQRYCHANVQRCVSPEHEVQIIECGCSIKSGTANKRIPSSEKRLRTAHMHSPVSKSTNNFIITPRNILQLSVRTTLSLTRMRICAD